LTPSSGGWTETILYSFTGGNDGAFPLNTLIFDGAGNLYGTASEGGSSAGTVFKLSPSASGWTETTLFFFDGSSNGSTPAGGLAWDAPGNLYGTTAFGGQNGGGTAFELTPSSNGWIYTQLAAFTGGEGPLDTPILDRAGNVYLSSYDAGGLGEIFELTQSQGTWTSVLLQNFQGGQEGSYPIGGVVLDANGNVYGTTAFGSPDHDGVIFEITP
jgi:uncharacterized repeat protein (TIGR03803 family)